MPKNHIVRALESFFGWLTPARVSNDAELRAAISRGDKYIRSTCDLAVYGSIDLRGATLDMGGHELILTAPMVGSLHCVRAP